jgi:hypothetical protein
LFGMSLLGRFCFVPLTRYTKRFHPSSTSAGWRIGLRHIISNTYVMRGYLADLCPRRRHVWLGTVVLAVWPWVWALRPYEITPRGAVVRAMRNLRKKWKRQPEL